jgi:hypothetical protein
VTVALKPICFILPLLACQAAASVVSAHPMPTAAVDLFACANLNNAGGQPVGFSTGNAPEKDAKLSFYLLDPSTGNNAWAAGSGASLTITLSVPTAQSVTMLLNSGWGQSGVINATVRLKGTGGAKQTINLVGDDTIRDWNNWIYTNIIDEHKTQEWWTSNLNPTPQDQTKRLDAHVFKLNSSFVGQTLTSISVISPPAAASGYMEPLLWAISVGYPGASGTLSSSCAQSGG